MNAYLVRGKIRVPGRIKPHRAPQAEGNAMPGMNCKTCGGEMVQNSRSRLFLVGVVMIASVGIAAYGPFYAAPGVLLFFCGVYLVVWATLGKGRWCRACKRFRG
jgi:hypothetical protein